MLGKLRAFDPELSELSCGDGAVVVAPNLQGRIFCRLGGELIHRLDVERLDNPSQTEFNNLGGNSLWPAPEGGAFAFNYPPGGGEWYVQKGIAVANPSVAQRDAHSVAIEKTVDLVNRRGVAVRLRIRRRVRVVDMTPITQGFDLRGIGYQSEDAFVPENSPNFKDVLIAPWSLEQFLGGEGVIAFGKVQSPVTALNPDFYGDPAERIAYRADHFTFMLGGPDRHQIGVKVSSNPHCIGALDSNRSLLILRYTRPQEGIYFNIADNEQPGGPFSAADLYSVFNGGPLGFFELETIGAMQISNDRVAPSTLTSETLILRGERQELIRFLLARENVSLQT